MAKDAIDDFLDAPDAISSGDEIDNFLDDTEQVLPFTESLTPLEQRLGGQIVDAVTGQRDPSQINILLNQARSRGAQAQSALNRAESVSQTSPLESFFLGAAKVPVGLASLAGIPINKALEASGPQGRAILNQNEDLASFINRELTERSAVNPLSGALGQYTATVAPIGPGGIVQNLARGELGAAARQLAVAAPINVGIGTGIRELAGADTTTEDVLNDVILSSLGGRIPSNELPVLTAPAAENALSRTLRESAEKNVVQGLLRGGGTKKEKALASKLAPQILDRPMSETFAYTGKGLERRAEGQAQKFGEAIEDFGALQGDVPLNSVVDKLEDLKSKYFVEGKNVSPEVVNRIQGVQDTISQYGDSLSKEGVRDIKRIFDEEIAESGGFIIAPSEKSLIKIKKVAANEMRELLAKGEPELAKINKQYSFFENLRELTASANERIKPQTGFTSKIAALAGFASGTGFADASSRAIIAKLFFDAIKSPGWKLTEARVKDKLADAFSVADPERLFNTLKQVKGFDPEQVLRTSAVQAADETTDQVAQ